MHILQHVGVVNYSNRLWKRCRKASSFQPLCFALLLVFEYCVYVSLGGEVVDLDYKAIHWLSP